MYTLDEFKTIVRSHLEGALARRVLTRAACASVTNSSPPAEATTVATAADTASAKKRKRRDGPMFTLMEETPSVDVENGAQGGTTSSVE